jgi:hypothetical protein
VSVLGLARQVAKRGTGSYHPRDHKLSGSPLRRAFENYFTPAVGSSARPVRYVFLRD